MKKEELEKKRNELNKQMEELEKQELSLAKEEGKLRFRELQQILDPLLSVVVTHSRNSSCSDEDPSNGLISHGRAQCQRCFLLQVKNGDFSEKDVEDFKFALDLKIRNYRLY